MKTIPVRIIIPLVAVAMTVALYGAVHADSISFGTPYWVTSNWSNSTTPTYGARASSNDGITCPGGAVQTGWRIIVDSANGSSPYSGSEYGTQCRQPSLAVTTGARTWVTSNWSNSTTPTYGAQASSNDGITCPGGSVQTGWRIVAIDPGMGVYEYGTQCQPLVSSVTLGTPYWVVSNSSSGSTPTGARASSNDGITCPNGSVQTGWRIIYTSSNDAYAPEGSGGSYDSYEYGTQCRPISSTVIPPPPPPPPPNPSSLSCSVTFDQNPLTGSATTMRWTSTGADLFYINQVGWVGASGSAQVSSPGDYSGTVSGAGGGDSKTYSTPGTYTFTVPDGVTSINYLVVGGGGGGGGDYGGPQVYLGASGQGGYGADLRGMGGGGAGGVRTGTITPTSGQQITVVVGAGGAGGTGGVTGGKGEDSKLGTIVGHGGGGGGSSDTGYPGGPGWSGLGMSGGSGGGGGGGGNNGCTGPSYGNVGNDGNVGGTGIAGEGNNGGKGSGYGTCAGGGGGGAGSVGGSTTSTDGTGAAGGNGIVSAISGTSVTYACGGGGGAGAAGGCSSAGKGASAPQGNGGDAQSGSGSGGGGTAVRTNGGPAYGGKGGSGSVIIAWGGTDGDGGTASCPAILRGTPSSCTPTSQTCRPNHNLVDSCGNTTVCRYGCSTQTNQCLTRETCVPYGVCNASGTKVVNVCDNATVDDCSARGSGWICSAGACRISAIGFQPFTGTNKGGQTFNATGHLQAVPALVRGGETVRIYWNTVNARTCTILGSNGDGAEGSPTGVWNTAFSGASGKTTSPISSQTTYTLLCHAFAGVIPPIVRESAIVNIIPSFQEL